MRGLLTPCYLWGLIGILRLGRPKHAVRVLLPTSDVGHYPGYPREQGNNNWWRELSLVLYLYHGLHRGKNELIYLHIRQRRQGILMTEIDVIAQVLWLQQNNLTLLDR